MAAVPEAYYEFAMHYTPHFYVISTLLAHDAPSRTKNVTVADGSGHPASVGLTTGAVMGFFGTEDLVCQSVVGLGKRRLKFLELWKKGIMDLNIFAKELNRKFLVLNVSFRDGSCC